MQPVKTIERDRSVDYIYEYPVKGKSHIEVSVYYTTGGTSYFSGDYTKRGIYVSVVPVDYSEFSISRTLFTGYKHLLEETARFSKGKLKSYSDYLNIDNPTVAYLIKGLEEDE